MNFFLLLLLFILKACTVEASPDLDILELLGLNEQPEILQPPENLPSLRNSASRFLREVYGEFQAPEENERKKRKTEEDDNFITDMDRIEMETCNNFITFSSKINHRRHQNSTDRYLRLYFNTNNVPDDLNLKQSTFRLYHDPMEIQRKPLQPRNVTISIYERHAFFIGNMNDIANFRVMTSLNMTTTYKGWLEFNNTQLLSKWLRNRRFRPASFANELLIDVTAEDDPDLSALQLGFVHTGLNSNTERFPFIIGFFNGPQLVEKIQKLRKKRQIIQRKRRVPLNFMPPGMQNYVYQLPKTCERLNFTVNFKDTHMDSWVIAPKKFEAYFCGGECNFPLGAHLNATNHAIVQTLMQLKQPHLPKPCCAPTILESITILRYLNEDNVNLVKFPQSVAKACGCH